jgi:hypothetical protein
MVANDGQPSTGKSQHRRPKQAPQTEAFGVEILKKVLVFLYKQRNRNAPQ